ncbi:MAG: hypothetical protein L0241_23735, partial [Planctomycetia bacterium]|nr:hypothetical protein [Planctomycetia bacterium]
MRLAFTVPALLIALLYTPTSPKVVAADPPAKQLDPQAVEFFEKKIRPVLTRNCFGCHSAEAEKNKKLKGNL